MAFRRDFLENPRFRDPSAALLDLGRRLQGIENAGVYGAVIEKQVAALKELLQGESSGSAEVDRLDAALARARGALSGRVRAYRDGLDAFKVEIGLSPHAPVTIDRGWLGAFVATFDDIRRWCLSPDRSLDALSQRVDGLPPIGDVTVDGRPLLDGVERDPDALDRALTTAARVAAANRRDRGADDGLELRVRRRVRLLAAAREDYSREKQRYLSLLRGKNAAVERLLAPPAAGRAPVVSLRGLAGEGVTESEDRLVGLWTAFRAERLGLYRDLGTLPFEDWASFLDQFAAAPRR